MNLDSKNVSRFIRCQFNTIISRALKADGILVRSIAARKGLCILNLVRPGDLLISLDENHTVAINESFYMISNAKNDKYKSTVIQSPLWMRCVAIHYNLDSNYFKDYDLSIKVRMRWTSID